MADTERHVKRFVFGRLLPVRGVDHVWERRYGWHWVVEREVLVYCKGLQWKATEWLYEGKPKKGWTGVAPLEVNILHGYQPKRDASEGEPLGPE